MILFISRVKKKLPPGNNFLEISLLGRNDNLSRYDNANGYMVNNNLDKKSGRERRRSGNSKTYFETRIFVNIFRCIGYSRIWLFTISVKYS